MAERQAVVRILRCPRHDVWSISVGWNDGGNVGLRIVGTKCCGRWDTVCTFLLSEASLRARIDDALDPPQGEGEETLTLEQLDRAVDYVSQREPMWKRAKPMRNPQGALCGLCDGTEKHEHPQVQCAACGKVGLEENWPFGCCSVSASGRREEA